MKLSKLFRLLAISFLTAGLLINNSAQAQSEDKDDKIVADANEAKADFIRTDGLMKNLFDNSAGYVIFPNIGKGAIGIGGAAGNGAVFQNGTLIGMAKMTQGSIGFQ